MMPQLPCDGKKTKRKEKTSQEMDWVTFTDLQRLDQSITHPPFGMLTGEHIILMVYFPPNAVSLECVFGFARLKVLKNASVNMASTVELSFMEFCDAQNSCGLTIWQVMCYPSSKGIVQNTDCQWLINVLPQKWKKTIIHVGDIHKLSIVFFFTQQQLQGYWLLGLSVRFF